MFVISFDGTLQSMMVIIWVDVVILISLALATLML